MSGKMMIGMALGAAIGMYVASKNTKVRQAISGAESTVMSKLTQGSGSGSQQQSDTSENA